MNRETEREDLNLCRSYLLAQLEDRQPPLPGARLAEPGPAVTIAHQTGAGAHEIARRLAAILQQTEPDGRCAWTVFDRQLIERVLEEHHLPKSLARLLTEERRSYIQDVMEELVGLRPPTWVMVPQVAETVLHLVEMGRVIIVGRGASVITARFPNVFHVRLVAPLPRRVETVQRRENLSRKDAERLVLREDRGRQRYVKAYLHGRLDDDLLYDLVLNTDRISCEHAAQLIADGARRFFRRGTPAKLTLEAR